MNNENEIVRLPLWKACLDKMRETGIAYGQTFTAEFLEKELRVTRDKMQFSLAISSIRNELLEDGFYLSGRGQKGNSFVVLEPASNQDVMRAFSRQASEALRRGVILGTNTRLDTLSESERRKHEGTLERMAIKCALLGRSKQIYAAIKDSHPKLIDKNP